ncbi:MAG TPA: helix-hairpin-helix domain-containing protein [Ktedonobacterales bacterium]|nr:helix-hairpin-helix domain-containing protein [Ktedonobacterales bacterium]
MHAKSMAQPAPAHLKDLQRIPGIGPSLARDLWDLGYRRVADLARQDAEALYAALETLRGQPLDPCVLYAFRCAVYFASTDEPDPALLKWWHWKNPPTRPQA